MDPNIVVHVVLQPRSTSAFLLLVHHHLFVVFHIHASWFAVTCALRFMCVLHGLWFTVPNSQFVLLCSYFAQFIDS